MRRSTSSRLPLVQMEPPKSCRVDELIKCIQEIAKWTSVCQMDATLPSANE